MLTIKILSHFAESARIILYLFKRRGEFTGLFLKGHEDSLNILAKFGWSEIVI